MNRQERIQQLEKLRVVKDDGRFVLEKFRIEDQIDFRSSACVFWRQVLCTAAAGTLFLCSFSPAFADPFRLDLPKERLIPQKVTPHLPPVGPFDQQRTNDLNEHSGESVQEKSSIPRSAEQESVTPQHPDEQHPVKQPPAEQHAVEEHSAQLDDPYPSNWSANHHSKQTQTESSSASGNSTTMTKKREEQIATSIQQQPIQRQTENGAKLPQTATPAGSMFLQGLALVLLGCALWKKSDVSRIHNSRS